MRRIARRSQRGGRDRGGQDDIRIHLRGRNADGGTAGMQLRLRGEDVGPLANQRRRQAEGQFGRQREIGELERQAASTRPAICRPARQTRPRPPPTVDRARAAGRGRWRAGSRRSAHRCAGPCRPRISAGRARDSARRRRRSPSLHRSADATRRGSSAWVTALPVIVRCAAASW